MKARTITRVVLGCAAAAMLLPGSAPAQESVQDPDCGEGDARTTDKYTGNEYIHIEVPSCYDPEREPCGEGVPCDDCSADTIGDLIGEAFDDAIDAIEDFFAFDNLVETASQQATGTVIDAIEQQIEDAATQEQKDAWLEARGILEDAVRSAIEDVIRNVLGEEAVEASRQPTQEAPIPTNQSPSELQPPDFNDWTAHLGLDLDFDSPSLSESIELTETLIQGGTQAAIDNLESRVKSLSITLKGSLGNFWSYELEGGVKDPFNERPPFGLFSLEYNNGKGLKFGLYLEKVGNEAINVTCGLSVGLLFKKRSECACCKFISTPVAACRLSDGTCICGVTLTGCAGLGGVSQPEGLACVGDNNGNGIDDAFEPGACCNAETGTCEEKLPWECENQGNLFQGSGTSCDVCQGNPFVSCNVDDDCYACDYGERADEKCGDAACPDGFCEGFTCIGGDNDGQACDCPGASCVGVGPCIEVLPACHLDACCDVNTGECAVGFCDQDPAKPCNHYDDSTDCIGGETCVLVDPIGGFDCPTGWSGTGYGIDCDPNCCPQPFSTDADTCMDAAPLIINVDYPGALITLTTSGNNSAATFDDFTEFVCDGGGNDGSTCDPDFDCPNGECVNGFCVGGYNDLGPCDPDSECTGDGTCDRICGLDIFNPDSTARVPDPGWWEAFYINAAANVRIDMCCTDPVHETQWAFLLGECATCGGMITPAVVDPPVGTGDSPYGWGSPFCDGHNLWQTYGPLPKGIYYHPIYSASDGLIGDYQFHVTAQALPLAACCSTVCVNGDWPGAPCHEDTFVTCLSGNCVGGFCVNGDLDGFACDPVTGEVDQCPGGGTCGDTTGCNVTNELICDAFDGSWMAGANLPDTDPPTEPVVSCDFDPCATGSCCTEPGKCQDESPGGDPMTEVDCELGIGGDYIGGVKCGWDPLRGGPCPVCPCAADPGNCQDDDGQYIYQIDRTNGPSRAVADDFIAISPYIGEFCFTPCFLAQYEDSTTFTECADPYTTEGPPPDDFEIRFYEDNNGLPGAELADSPGPVDIAAKAWQGGDSRCWDYAVLFDPPVSGLVVGQRYWVSFSAAGSPYPPEGTGCTVFLSTSLQGNGWALLEYDHYGDVSWDANDLLNRMNNGHYQDWGFCIDGGLMVPDPMVGACCQCDDLCNDAVAWEDCLGYYDIDSQTGIAIWTGANLGIFSAQTECGELICEDMGTFGGVCPGDPSGIPGEDCVLPKVVDEGEHDITNVCSSANEPCSYPVCGGATNMSVEADLWFEYHACGDYERIDIDICDSTYVNALAVYTNGTDTCPLPIECESEGGSLDPYLVSCIDEKCPTNGPTTSLYPENEGKCFLIRVMGQAGRESMGTGVMEITCIGCLVSSPPQPETLDLVFNPISQKIRYLSFAASDVGRTQAVRVTFRSVPSPYDAWNGVQLYVQEPQVYCENAGVSQQDPCPEGAGGLPSNDFWGAGLDCDPYFTDWTQYDVIHVWNEGVIPDGVYDIQVVDDSCSLIAEESYSPALTITQSGWADLIQDCTTTPCKPPDGSTGIVDVTAVLDKWKNLPGNVKKVRADIEGSPAGDHRIPDQAINITDVTYCLGAFLGEMYPPPGFPPPSPPPVCPQSCE